MCCVDGMAGPAFAQSTPHVDSFAAYAAQVAQYAQYAQYTIVGCTKYSSRLLLIVCSLSRQLFLLRASQAYQQQMAAYQAAQELALANPDPPTTLSESSMPLKISSCVHW